MLFWKKIKGNKIMKRIIDWIKSIFADEQIKLAPEHFFYTDNDYYIMIDPSQCPGGRPYPHAIYHEDTKLWECWDD